MMPGIRMEPVERTSKLPIQTDGAGGSEKAATRPLPAPFWKRAIANIIDYQIIYWGGDVMKSLAYSVMMLIDPTSERQAIIVSLIASILWIWGYYPVMESSNFQATIGKIILMIKVVDYHGRRISFSRSCIRMLLRFVSFSAISLGYIWAFFDKYSDTWHDKWSRTVAVIR